ncbi:MAG TPA: hypothetical protein VLN45_03950 [Ignavibacteriaceae bacterium]|nr:hypothetical protein [Ignavibacteriaceae bacterium]
MIKIITVYKENPTEKDVNYGIFNPIDMSNGRWIKISDALSRLGYEIDIAIPDSTLTNLNGNGHLNTIQLSKVNWDDYDIVKTEFHLGFDTLEKYGGTSHPFIISKLGSVVGLKEMDGIYFYGDMHKKLLATQEKINNTSKYITVLSKPAEKLWEDTYGIKNNILHVPGAVDSLIPSPVKNPYNSDNKIKVIFAGNVYTKSSQPEANYVLVKKLNELGKWLSKLGAKLYMIGPGDISLLDQEYVNYLGVIPFNNSWDYFYFANVGVVVSAGKFMHNNESTKIYHYLRSGLPVVSEAGFPNDNVIEESGLGYVSENGDMELMAENIIEAANNNWNKEKAVNYILQNHTWDERVKVYDKIIREHFGYKINSKQSTYKKVNMAN